MLTEYPETVEQHFLWTYLGVATRWQKALTFNGAAGELKNA